MKKVLNIHTNTTKLSKLTTVRFSGYVRKEDIFWFIQQEESLGKQIPYEWKILIKVLFVKEYTTIFIVTSQVQLSPNLRLLIIFLNRMYS